MSLLEIGQIMKAHGLKGEVVVQLVTNRTDRLDAGSRLSTKLAGARRVPDVLEVVAARPFQNRYLVLFAGCATRDDADGLRGVTLLAEAETAAGDELYVHELIGKRLLDQHGNDRGEVRSVEANPASDLLVVDSGALVPLRFVSRVEGATIHVEVPDGLFE
jgi:16S rRNA processing protein RimM